MDAAPPKKIYLEYIKNTDRTDRAEALFVLITLDAALQLDCARGRSF